MDNDMNVLYHPSIANVVAYALSRLSMHNVAYVEKERKKLAKDVHRLACFWDRLICMSDGGVIVYNGPSCSLVVKIKENQDRDSILLQLNGANRVNIFSYKGHVLFCYQGLLCVHKVGKLR